MKENLAVLKSIVEWLAESFSGVFYVLFGVLNISQSSAGRKKTVLEDRVVFWHHNAYRTGKIIRKYSDGSLEIDQDPPFSGPVRKNKQDVVLEGKSGRVTIYS